MTEQEHNVAIIKGILWNLDLALANYGHDKAIADARSSGHSLSQFEILERTGEQLTVKLSIEITK